jgi:hypothetical protein
MKHNFLRAALLSAVFLLIEFTALAQQRPSAEPAPAVSLPIGGAKFEGWTGLNETADGAVLKVPGAAVYTVPVEGKKSTLDASAWYGLRFDVKLDPTDAPFMGELKLMRPPTAPGDRQDMVGSTKAPLRIEGKGWHTITLPFTAFDYNRGQSHVLKDLQKLALSGRYEGGDGSGQIQLRNVRLVLGNILHLASDIRSLPADADGTVTYSATVTNCAESTQLVTLALERSGWEGMPAIVKPETMTLAAGQSEAVTISVTVPAWMPGGARETQMLVAMPQAEPPAAETLKFITSRRLPFPFLVHTAAEWDEVRAKVQKYDWAKEEQAEYVRAADAFQVPNVRPPNQNGVFMAYIEQKLWPCAVAWKLTGKKEYAEKIALFLRRLSDPATGFPTKAMAQSADIPQEGGLWEVAVWSYDMIDDSGLLTTEDKAQIEKSFRRFATGNAGANGYGGISNWSVFNLCPAAQVALALHDFVTFDELMNGPSGIIDHLRYGMMDDGWWYEMALSYNLGCAEAFTNLGIAARPLGINFLHEKFPVATTRIVGLRPFEFQNFKGMAFGKYGPVRDNTVSIKKMWDGIVDYPDYRGVMFGMGDGHEEEVGGRHFDKAYFAFQNPAYATVIKQGGRRDLLFAVPELPAETPRTYAVSAHSDDAGIAVLRSQTPGREPREQIQASFKYGTHGSYHGHFDRLALNSLERSGRSFYNPETSWYGYQSYMYKWWVQVSLSHNMVVVDGKMQEPQECTPLLFYSGPMMQVLAAGTTTRWSNPPYLGGYDQIDGIKKGDKPYVPIPDLHPMPGDITSFTEPVRQRRVVIVTDDYVVLADDLKADKEHTFDNLLHLRAASLADPAKAQLLRHDEQFNTDPLGSGQFITNVNHYAVTAPALVHSIFRAGNGRNWETGGQKSRSEPGVLQIDEHVLWPQKPELLIGDYPECWPVDKKLSYEVQGDGKTLASGTFGAWILGSGKVDVDVTGLKTLKLTTNTTSGRDTRNITFWGNPTVVTFDGRNIPLSQLKMAETNVLAVPQPDRDYEGGSVRIAGNQFEKSVPAEPRDPRSSAVLAIDLAGVGAVRFKATVGGDWPVGDEEQLRKVISVHTKGRSAQSLILIEPYESHRMVKAAVGISPNEIQVELIDGRLQDITIQNLGGDAGALAVKIKERRNGKPDAWEYAMPLRNSGEVQPSR